MKRIILKSLLSWIFFFLGIILCFLSIQAFNNWNNIPVVSDNTPLTKDLWNTTMNTLTWNIQQLKDRLDSDLPTWITWWNNYITFPNWIIMQWGAILSPSGWSTSVTFPIPFPNEIMSIQISRQSPTSNTWWMWTSAGISTTPTKMGFVASHPSDSAWTYYWFAVGR